MITINVNTIRSQIVGQLAKEVINKIDSKLSYELPGAFFMQQRNPWLGVKKLFSKITQSFPTGLIHYVETILQTYNLEYEIIDCRTPITLGTELPYYGLPLRDYQLEAVNRAIQKQRGIIKIATGGGKSLVLAQIIAKLNIPTLILTHKVDLLYQLQRVFKDALKVSIGVIGDGKCAIEQFTVATIQTIAKAYDKPKKRRKSKEVDVDDNMLLSKSEQIQQLVESVQCLIVDEVHHISCDSYWTVHKQAKNALYRVSCSASPWREDGADLLIEAAMAKQLIDIKASNLIERGYLVPPTVYLLNFKHERKSRDDYQYSEIYDDEIMNNLERNKLIVKAALKAASQKKTVLIAVTKVEHGKTLEAMLQTVEPDSLFVFGESDSELRQQVLQELNERKRKIVICTTIFGEGIDVPNLDVLINAKAASSSVDAFQLIGRVLRKTPQKSRAYVVDIFDKNCKYIGSHTNSRLRIYQTEPRYELKEVFFVLDLNFKE